MVTAPGRSLSEPGPTTQLRVGGPQLMKYTHSAARRAAIAMLGLCLAVPVTGFTSTAWAKSDQATKSVDHGKGNNPGADKANNGQGNGANKADDSGSAVNTATSNAPASTSATSSDSAPAAASGGNGAAPGQIDQPPGCPNTYHNNSNGGGANGTGAYNSTCDGTPSQNGNGDGKATGSHAPDASGTPT